VNDDALVARSTQGDREAFGELVRRHVVAAHDAAYAVLHNEADADDACQDAFLSALLNIERLDPTRSFRPWLLHIVRNRALDLCRRRRVRASDVLGSGAGEVDVTAPAHERPDAYAERSDLRQSIAGAVATLAEPYRTVLLLHDLEGLQHREVGARLGCATGTSRHHLFTARRLVRGRLRVHLPADAPQPMNRSPVRRGARGPVGRASEHRSALLVRRGTV
jgi:RNA polymerase sigma-70 factor, ECF subfamily